MPPTKTMHHPVPEEHLKHIGDIIVSFALLESCLESLIWSFIAEHQRVGQIITAELSLKNLRALAISLYLERHGKDGDYSKLKLLMNEVGVIEERRNQIVHSVWGAGKDKNHITRIKSTAKEKNGIKFQAEVFSVEDFSNFAHKILQCAQNIQSFYFELINNNKAINNPIHKIW